MDEQSRGHLKSAQRSKARMRITIALVLLFSSTIIFATELPSPTQSAKTHDELALRGKHLRAAFEAKYRELRAKKAIARENDITSTVLQYVSPSMPIEDVTRVLRSAGFGEPGVTVRGHLFFSMRLGGFLSFEQVAVDIAPQAPGDFHVIQAVTGALFGVDL